MNRPHDDTLTEALRSLLHLCLDTVKERLVSRLDAWLQRAQCFGKTRKHPSRS